MNPAPSPWLSPRRWLLGLAVIVLMGVGAWKGRNFYREWRLRNFLREGRAALQRGDYRSAETWVRHALQGAPQNREAVRLGAEVEEAQDLPDTAAWWARVVQLQPGDVDAIFSWTKAALRTGRGDVAGRALQLTPPAARQSADYQELLAGVALAAHRPDAADAALAEAARLDPKNPVHRLNLASLRLEARDAAIVDVARRELEASAEATPALRLLAWRALLGDAVRRQDAAAMQTWRARLLAAEGRSWNDEILCLSAAPSDTEFQSELTALEERAANDLRQTVSLADWLTAHGHAAETQRWLTSLPEARRAEVRVQICLANGLIVNADWQALRTALGGGNWRQLDFLRRANEIRAAREIGEPVEASWRALLTDLAAQPEALLMVGQTAQAWGWRAEAEDVFWRATKQPFEVRRGALQSLWLLYSAAHDTAGLLRVARQQYEDTPDDTMTRNNYAFLSLLLNSNPTIAKRLAREVGTAAGAPPQCVATQAFALIQAGQSAEAVALLRALPEAQRRQPGIALYYALALDATAESGEAKGYAALAEKGELLPEEQRLLEGLQAKSSALTP